MTMVVQHLENRLALNSVRPNEQLHEFQIVHALITQCRKQVSYEETDNNSNGYECLSPPRDLKDRTVGIDKSDKTSFVNTIRQTFNALAQATNPSLCAKQNAAHPVSIASTVKNIISQFSRQACHGSIYSSSKESDLKSDTSQSKVIKRQNPSTQINRRNYKRVESEAVLEPSTSQDPVVERTEVKCATVVRQKTNTIPATAKLKARVERTRNGSGLVRHESAPPLLDQGKLRTVKKTTSVKRSKSDAVCYQTYSKRNRRRIDSNVQTKVLHFEKCCEESMCIECRRRSLEEEQNTSPKPVSADSLISSRADTIIPKQESFMGALSYHKPSIISQNATSSAVPTESSNDAVINGPTNITKIATQTTVKPKAVMCPGGTYFPCNGYDNDQISPRQNNATFKNNATIIMKDESLDVKLQENDSSYAEMTGSNFSDRNIDSCEKTMSVPQDVVVLQRRDGDVIENDILITNTESDGIKSSSTENHLSLNKENLYTKLCSVERVDSLDATDLAIDSDSSDNVDNSSSSSNESSPSPQQDYIDRCNGLMPLTRSAPSARYKRIRRKLKKLITRPRSCSEAVQQEVFLTQAEREQEFLLSLRIPTPTFMLPEGSASFDVKRQQLAMHFEKNKDYMKRLPDHVLVQIFSHLDTRSLATLKCVCADFNFLINSYDIRGIDSLWVKDVRYMEDPCRFCRKKFTTGDVSMCRYHAKYYHCDLPYGRSYWMCCFQLEKNAPGCKTGIHNNRWAQFQDTSN